MTSPEAIPVPLPVSHIHGLVAPFFEQASGFRDMVQTYGSPLYVVMPDTLIRQANRFRSAFQSRIPDTAFFYAMKSNNLPVISQTLLAEGFGLDVSSGTELSVALELGADPIIFSGPGKTVPELELAARHSDRVTVLMDSPGECRRVAEVAARAGRIISVGIRINCNPEGLWRKFGVALHEVLPLWQDIRNHPVLAFHGFQFHSSWNLNPARQVAFIKILGDWLKTMPDPLVAGMDFLDIGGGYWPCAGEWLVTEDPLSHEYVPAAGIDVFAKELSRAIRDHIFSVRPCRICLEPGRWICQDALHILVQVIDRKAPDMVITDGGTHAVGWERFETDYFPVLNLSRPAMRETPCHIFGALCTPHDIWGYAYWGEDIREGDVLMIPCQGAYTWSLRQEFIKPLPRVVVVGSTGETRMLPDKR